MAKKRTVVLDPLQTFYYHDKGMDVNGNYKSIPTDPGWIAVVGRDAESAIDRLPKEARAKVKLLWAGFKRKRNNDGYDYSDFEDVMAATAGWGIGFSFLNEVDWESFLDEFSDDPKLCP